MRTWSRPFILGALTLVCVVIVLVAPWYTIERFSHPFGHRVSVYSLTNEEYRLDDNGRIDSMIFPYDYTIMQDSHSNFIAVMTLIRVLTIIALILAIIVVVLIIVCKTGRIKKRTVAIIADITMMLMLLTPIVMALRLPAAMEQDLIEEQDEVPTIDGWWQHFFGYYQGTQDDYTRWGPNIAWYSMFVGFALTLASILVFPKEVVHLWTGNTSFQWFRPFSLS